MIRPSRYATKAPFGDQTGYYTLPEPYPVFHITAITHRKDAVYPATIVGIPPMEDFYIGGASVKLFLPIFKMNFPEIVDIALPAGGRLPKLCIEWGGTGDCMLPYLYPRCRILSSLLNAEEFR